MDKINYYRTGISNEKGEVRSATKREIVDRRVFGLDKTAEKRYTDDVFFEVFTEDKAACDSEPEETVDDGVHEEGREEGRKKTVINLYSKGMSTEDISKWLDVPPQYVGSVIADFKK